MCQKWKIQIETKKNKKSRLLHFLFSLPPEQSTIIPTKNVMISVSTVSSFPSKKQPIRVFFGKYHNMGEVEKRLVCSEGLGQLQRNSKAFHSLCDTRKEVKQSSTKVVCKTKKPFRFMFCFTIEYQWLNKSRGRRPLNKTSIGVLHGNEMGEIQTRLILLE